MHPHPWRRLRELAHVKLNWVESGRKGRVRHSTQEIFLRTDLTQAERRSVLLHEIEHLAGGPAVRGYRDLDERDTTARACRWLIPIEALLDGLIYCRDDVELAEHLWVDLKTVQARLTGLTAAETEWLNERMDAAELGFPKFD